MNNKLEIQICLGSSCFSRGNRELVQYVREYLKKNHLDDMVTFSGSRCMGHCINGPVIVISDRLFENVGLAEIVPILEKEFGNLK